MFLDRRRREILGIVNRRIRGMALGVKSTRMRRAIGATPAPAPEQRRRKANDVIAGEAVEAEGIVVKRKTTYL